MKALLLTMGLLLCGTSALAADVSTSEGMARQAAKLAPNSFTLDLTRVKKLCICHRGDNGGGVMGFLQYNTVFFVGVGDRVSIDCIVPTYSALGPLAAATPCVEGGIGTFWDLVK